jgi:hypothetical protein
MRTRAAAGGMCPQVPLRLKKLGETAGRAGLLASKALSYDFGLLATAVPPTIVAGIAVPPEPRILTGEPEGSVVG